MDPKPTFNLNGPDPLNDGRAVLVAFGGRSPEHEVSILTALQAMAALASSGLRLLPLYVTKQGDWLTGSSLGDLDTFQDLDNLEPQTVRCTLLRDPQRGVVLKGTDGLRGIRLLRAGREERELGAGIPLQAALLAFHGGDGENGAFQGLFQSIGLPYTGSDVSASSLGMDKARAKEVARSNGVPVVRGFELSEADWIGAKERMEEKTGHLGFPLIVKPVRLGSSIGIRAADSLDMFREAVEDGFRYDRSLLVEQQIRPLVEVNCSVLGDETGARASVCERPLGGDELLSFADKYLQGAGGGSGPAAKGAKTAKAGGSFSEQEPAKGMASASRVIPADIPDPVRDRIQEYALRLFHAFGCSGVARFDFLLQLPAGSAPGESALEPEEIYFNEVNTIPGSFSFYLWSHSGLGMDKLLLDLLSLAIAAGRRRSGRALTFESNLLRHHQGRPSGKHTK